MSTVDLTLKNRNNIPRRSVVKTSVIKFDDRGDGTAPVSADVHQLWQLPAGAIVLEVWYTPITSFNEGTSAVLSIGDGDSSTRFHSGVNIKTITANAPVKSATNYRYAAADTVDAIITYGGGTAPTTGEVRVGIRYIDPTSDERYA